MLNLSSDLGAKIEPGSPGCRSKPRVEVLGSSVAVFPSYKDSLLKLATKNNNFAAKDS